MNQIIEILGKKVEIVEDDGHACHECAFYDICSGIPPCLCYDSQGNSNRHFFEITEEN